MNAVQSYIGDIASGVFSSLKGMRVTWKHMFRRAITVQYPAVRLTLPARSRNRLFNKIEDCIGCGQCARACPVKCIFIETEKREKDEHSVFAADGTPIKLRTTRFDIDMTLCCYCGLCTVPCPTHCLVMTPEYEYSVFEKKDLLYRFAVDRPRTLWQEDDKGKWLLPPEVIAKMAEEEAAKKKAAAAAAAAKAAAAPPAAPAAGTSKPAAPVPPAPGKPDDKK